MDLLRSTSQRKDFNPDFTVLTHEQAPSNTLEHFESEREPTLPISRASDSPPHLLDHVPAVETEYADRPGCRLAWWEFMLPRSRPTNSELLLLTSKVFLRGLMCTL